MWKWIIAVAAYLGTAGKQPGAAINVRNASWGICYMGERKVRSRIDVRD